MKKTVVLSCLIGVLFLLAAAPQEQDERIKRKVPEFEQLVTINLTLLDVIVTDAAGNYVHGLTKDDFLVEEEKKPVSISSVDEYFLSSLDADSSGDKRSLYDSPPRNLIFILDKFFSSTRAINRGKEAITEFINRDLQPGDRAMIMTYERSFNTIQDFSTDPSRLQYAVGKIAGMSISADTPEMQMNIGSRSDQIFRMDGTDISNANPFSDPVDTFKNVRMSLEIRTFLDKLRLLAKSFKSIPGRKTVILLSEGYDSRFINENPNDDFGEPPEFGADPDNETQQMLMMQESMNRDVSGIRSGMPLLSVYNKMVDNINDSTTSFYVLDLSSFGGERSRADQFHQQSSNQRADYNDSRLQSLAALADNSGGKLYTSASDLGGVMDEINTDISNFYIIGFHPNNTKADGKFRNVSIRTVNPSFTVRTRKGYFEPKPFAKMDKEDRYVQLVEGLFRANPVSELKAHSSIFFLPVYANTVVASLAVQFPVDQLGVGSGEKAMEVLGTVTDSNNHRRHSFHNEIFYGDKFDDIVKDGNLTMKIPLLLGDGSNKVRVIFRDDSTGKRFYVFDEYVVQGTTTDSLYMSSIAIFDENVKSSSVEKYDLKIVDKGQRSGFDSHRIPDPLRASTGNPIFPRLDTNFKQGEKPIIFFAVGNFWQDPDSQKVDFFIDYTLIDKNGKEILIPVGKERLIPVPGVKRLNVLSQLDLSGVESGVYTIRIRFLDQMKLQGVQRFIQISIQ